MPFRDILVHVDEGKSCESRLAVAARLAAAHQARLTGLFTRLLPRLPGYVSAQLGPEVQLMQDKYAREVAARAQEAFNKAAGLAGVSTEWRVAEGDAIEAVALHTRYADLVVVGQTDPDSEDQSRLADHLVLDAGRPVLVVPYVGRYETMGRKVIVAWNASREATRAVNDAMPFLQAAEKVTVLAINPTGGPNGHGDVPGADICLHLARHEVKAEAAYLKAEDIDVGNMLLSRIADEDADLLVMGAYGRSRLREIVLGGATRHILDHMTVPVLMSH